MKYIVAIWVSFLLSNVCVFAQNTNEAKADSAMTTQTEQAVSSEASNPSAVLSDYTLQLEQALAKKDTLAIRRKALHDDLSKGNDKEKELHKQLKKLKKEIDNVRERVQDLLDAQPENPYEEIIKLEASIDQKQKQLCSLKSKLDSLNHQLSEASNNKSELDKVKQDVSSKLVSEHKPYIELPFAQMRLEHLSAIRAICKQFATSPSIDSLVASIDSAINNLKGYDEIQKVLNSKYSKFNLERMLEKVQTLKAASKSQQHEINEMKKQLHAFEEGLESFKEFINNLNRCRNGANYSFQYFQDDEESIFREGLKQRITEKLLIVPYLKNKYEAFMKALKKNPNMHTDIEAEILNQ